MEKILRLLLGFIPAVMVFGTVISGCNGHEDEPPMPEPIEVNPDTVKLGGVFDMPTSDGTMFYDHYDFASFTPVGKDWEVTKLFTDTTASRGGVLRYDYNGEGSFENFEFRTKNGKLEIVAEKFFDSAGIGFFTGIKPIRYVNIELTYPDHSDTIAVVQEAKDYLSGIPAPRFIFSPSNAAFTANGGRKRFGRSGSYWEFHGTSDTPGMPFPQPCTPTRYGTVKYDWLTVTVDGPFLILDAEPNETGEFRMKILLFNADLLEYCKTRFNVTQPSK